MTERILIANSNLIYKILNIFFILILFGFIGFFIHNANKGFDITDESYSLLWAMQPENVSAWVNPFGFITKQIWILSGENIRNFRIISVVILFLTALIFAISLDYFMTKKHHQTSNVSLKIISISALIVSSFIYFHKWQLFLSYNLLNLASCLLVISGLFIVYGQNKKQTSLELIGGIIVGLGGFVSFLSKPTTSFFLAIIVLTWVIFCHQNSKKYYFVITAVTSAIVSILYSIYTITDGVIDYYKYLTTGMNLLDMAQTGHDWKSLTSKIYTSYKPLISTSGYYFFYTPVFILLLALLFLQRSREYYKKNSEKIVLFLTFFFLLAMAFIIREAYLGNKKELFAFFNFSTITLFLSVLTLNKQDKLNKQKLENISSYILVVLTLFALPFIYSFGTRSLISTHSFGVLIFLFAIWIYSFNILLKEYAYKKYIIVLFSLLMAIMTTIVIYSAFTKPNRLIDMRQQDTDVMFHGVEGAIKVDKKTAKYANDLKDIANEHGWKEKNLLIDLTGASPGALVILNAKIVGSPWLSGGWTGSENYIKAYIKLSGENPSNSWILTAPNGKRSVSVSVLSDGDYDFNEKYQLVGKLSTGYRNELQFLWKPKQ